nr:hypothetical protein [Tanacetum cinerariifolium]
MATTIEQQVALDEALVPSAQRLRIGRSNFRLPSDIQSKESTLQVVYDVLRQTPFFKAFLVTADVPEIYMQEFWVTATVHQHSIRFKMDTRKHIVDLESFREMLHISLRVLGQSFTELPFEEEILEFLSLRLSQAQILWGLYHRRNVDYAFLIWEDVVYQVEHKNQKKSNEMYYLRFTKVIIHHFMMKKPSIPRRNNVNWHYIRDDILFSTIKVVSRHQNTQQYGAILPIELTTEDIKNTKAYKEYHACATGEAAPKPKASAKKKKGGFASSITPPTPIATPTPTTTILAAPRLSAAAKGKQPARVTTPTEPIEVERTEVEQLKIVLRRSREETYISQQHGSGTNEGTGSTPGVSDVPSDDSKEELSWNSSDEEDDEAEKGNDDNDDEEEISKIGEQEVTESDEGDDEATESDRESLELIFTTGSTTVTPIPSPQSTMTPSIISTFTTASQLPTPPTQIPSLNLQSLLTFASQMPESFREAVQTQTDRLQDSIQRENDEFLKTIDENMKKIIKEQVKTQVKAQVTRILPRIEESVNAQLEAKVLTRLSQSSRISYAVAADLSEMELKKILIDKMEGNKSIQRSDEQRNLYKALVEAYDADKTILDTYGESTILKRRREDDDQEGPSAGSDRRSTTGTQSQQLSANESAFAEEPVQTTCQMEEPSHPPRRPPTPDRDWNKTLPAAQGNVQSWISALAKKTNARSSFNELLDTPINFSNFIMNRLDVDTLTLDLLAGPTYELMRGSCKSLTELEYHLEEVYKETTYQLDWVNPEGQQYPYNLLQPLPLIPDNRGRRVIPFEHFINNDLEYLWGGASSRKYTTSVTKTKAADYGHIKWIEDLVPRFYGFAVNQESALDVYSKRRIIAVTELKIVEWHNYKHLDWISLGVESYQKRLNLTKPDTYRSDLKRREVYTAYSNPRGFIYQNKDKKNRLMRIDELHKFSDRTLNDVRNALDDRLKGIRMQYLPTII